MANNFSWDATVEGLWRFESGAITTDSSGNSNTLTDHGTVGNGATYYEGAASADFEDTSSQYLSRADADLSAGFPLKAGDTTKKISISFWMKPETVPSTTTGDSIVGKYDTGAGKRSFLVSLQSSKLRISNGYNAGASGEGWDVCSISAGSVYHVSMAHDGVAKTCTVRVWDAGASTATTYTHSWDYETNVEDALFAIGCLSSVSNYYDGILDELVVFSRLLSEIEMDRIRQGVFAWYPDEMASLSAIETAEWATADALYRPFLIF